MGLAGIDALKPSAYSGPLMRFWLAGLLVLALPAAAFAQARGQVLSLGFNNRYRADCWTPMLVQLSSQSADSQDYQIQIVQEDMDRDRVTYTQTVTLGGNVEGRPATTENFWAYFKPKPVDGGLPDATDMGTTLATLNSELKVILCDKDGKPLSTLPLTSTIINVDPKRSPGDGARGSRLILFVSDGTDQPEISDYSQQKGVLQDVEAVQVAPRDLPGNVIGYEAVDTIVWMDADANFLTSGTHTPSLEALMQWVHQGGHLVVCEPAESIKIKPFQQILPVGGQVEGQWMIPTVDRRDLDVLNRLAHPNGDSVTPAWPGNLGTFKVARVPALPGSKVDEWLTWTDGSATTFTPWLARRTVGLGAVTWVAQDLGNAALTRQAKTGWRYVWDRVFDWNDPTGVSEDYKPVDGHFDAWPQADKAVELGDELSSHGMDLPSTAAYLLAIAGFFFVVYWLVAGPGIYLFLVARKQANLSWFMFGLTAVAATLLTALLVKIVVRGPPKLEHFSVVRYAAGEPNGVIDSRFGLYVREDGPKTIALQDTAEHEVSYVTPFSIHPQFVGNTEELPAYLEYQVPVPDSSDSAAVSATIPFRSTLKKLQAHWVGEMKGTIDASPDTPTIKLDADNKLAGTLINHTGYDLWHVFLAFKRPKDASARDASSDDSDIIVYVEQWAKDDSLKLDDLINRKTSMNLDVDDKTHHPMGADTVYGDMGLVTDTAGSWGRFWRSRGDELSGDLDNVLPMLTLFDRLPPWADQKDERSERFELRRYGARLLDLSPALSSGSLVVCARAMIDKETDQTPLPVPMTVSDATIEGHGTTFYEFVLPVDRSAVSGEPSTQPSAQ
jgi:hypothetical protein